VRDYIIIAIGFTIFAVQRTKEENSLIWDNIQDTYNLTWAGDSGCERDSKDFYSLWPISRSGMNNNMNRPISGNGGENATTDT
jgi:hypothetical protein